ncbi:hypothetical protein K1T71_004050 [Dendrolimus kikuchii]|uniref:Uncharacterized protein n=1 Tax=Dendrolimus kikuchii TaxID=765133 RepID=A0ACC1DAH6_9NEOP|nr:hypothetical protein K1T71_004050 [Dendrolimus kikuchii]
MGRGRSYFLRNFGITAALNRVCRRRRCASAPLLYRSHKVILLKATYSKISPSSLIESPKVIVADNKGTHRNYTKMECSNITIKPLIARKVNKWVKMDEWSLPGSLKMTDSDRIVLPYEVEDVQTAAKQAKKREETTSLKETSLTVTNPWHHSTIKLLLSHASIKAFVHTFKSWIKMADTDRVVFPDEVDDVKAAAKEPENTEEVTTPEETSSTTTSQVTMRNMITAPANCPAGYQMGSDGVCREVFN